MQKYDKFSVRDILPRAAKKSELDRICGEVFSYHERDFEDYRVVKFSQVKPRQLLDLVKSVNERVSVYEQLSRSFGNVQVVLKEALDSEQCFVVERIDRAFLEHFL